MAQYKWPSWQYQTAAIVWLYYVFDRPGFLQRWGDVKSLFSGKKGPIGADGKPSTPSASFGASTGTTVPGLVPLGPGAGRYQPATDYSWLSNPAAYGPYGYPPYNGVPTGAPNVPPAARRPAPPSSRVGTDPATGQPASGTPRSPVAPPIAGLPAANIRDPYLEQFPRVTNDTYGGSYNPWAGSATQYLTENQTPTNNYDYASTLPSGSATQYLTEQYQPVVQETSSPPAQSSYSGGDGYSSNNQSVSYDYTPPAYEPPEAPAYEPVAPPAEDYGGGYNPYDQGQPAEDYGGGDNPYLNEDIYSNRGE